jgi:putative nucleotidyltransferase with HDIG domain
MLKLEEFLPAGWKLEQYYTNIYKHSKTTANAAKLIAKHIDVIDEEIAYLCGLMHDVGKFYLKKHELYKHPRIGYELTKNKSKEISEVCISHAFPNFEAFDHILAYCHGDNEEAYTVCDILKTIKRSVYVDMIQFCDKISGLDRYMTLDTKYAWYLGQNANFQDDTSERYFQSLLKVKASLDELASRDLYEILGIGIEGAPE